MQETNPTPNAPPIIQPTVGRVVHFYPSIEDPLWVSGRPLAAIVAYVWSDSCVNLAIFDSNGVSTNRTSVYLVQPGNERPSGGFCEWMPYQKGQAAKTEALERQLIGVDLASGPDQSVVGPVGQKLPDVPEQSNTADAPDVAQSETVAEAG